METNTQQYEFSHGHKPRGFGCWAFEVMGTDGNGAYTASTYFVSGKFSEARAEAVRRLKRECGAVRTVVEVKVLS